MTYSRSKIAIAVIALVAVFILSLTVAIHRRTGTNALNDYKAELRAKGELLLVGDLPPPICTNGNPNLIALTNAVSQLQWNGSAEKLSMMNCAESGHARATWSGDLMNFDGTTNDWEELDSDLTNNASILQTIRELLNSPEPDTRGAWTNIFDPPKTFVARRTAARWLAVATLDGLHQNQSSNALENLHTLFQLAQMQKDDFGFINQMIRVAISEMAVSATWEALQAPEWTEEQLLQTQTDLSSLDLLGSFEKGLVGDRIQGNEAFQSLSTITNYIGQSETVWLKGLKAVYKEDELFYLKSTQHSLEQVRLLQHGKPWREVKLSLVDEEDRRQAAMRSYRKYLHLLSAIALPTISRASQKAAHVETERQMALASVALWRYQLRRGKLPKELSELIPEFLPKLPWDVMDQKPIKYRITETSFVIYSVGEDGVDDGGNPKPTAPLGTKKYEIWDGRDAVWPEIER